jgi:hypothetical protein
MTISIRHSPSTKKNQNIRDAPPREGETNMGWLQRVGPGKGEPGGLILLGGSSVSHFRIRFAQSQLRTDLMPSFWSLVGVMMGDQTFVSVPLDLREHNSDVPKSNGIQTCNLKDYDDPVRFPNIAVINFTEAFDSINQNIDRIKAQRSVVDLPSLILPWLGYVWGTSQAANPLVAGQGLPSAVFVETVYGLAGIELTPGLSSSSSCPEAIWSSALWWHDFYEEISEAEKREETPGEAQDDGSDSSVETTQAKSFKRAKAMIPMGSFTIRQPEAAVKG